MLLQGDPTVGHGRGLLRPRALRFGLGAIASFIAMLVTACVPSATTTATRAERPKPIADALQVAELLSDEELAGMRGRFVDAGEVTYFGLQMVTLWQRPDGSILNTGLEWGVDLSGGSPDPSFTFHTFSPSAEPPGGVIGSIGTPGGPVLETGAGSVPLAPTAGGGGLETAAGIIQRVAAAGDFNDLGNDLGLAIVGSAAAASGNPVIGFGSAQTITETTTVTLADGTKATAFIEPNAIGVVVNVPGTGRVLQEVRGGVGRAAQHIDVTSNLNIVRNTMRINFGVNPATSERLRQNVLTTLGLLRGLR